MQSNLKFLDFHNPSNSKSNSKFKGHTSYVANLVQQHLSFEIQPIYSDTDVDINNNIDSDSDTNSVGGSKSSSLNS